MQNLGKSLQSLELNVESCKSQEKMIEGHVFHVHQGLQSALGQVATQVQQSDSHTRALENKISQVQGAVFQKIQVVAPVPSPVTVPVTINIDKSRAAPKVDEGSKVVEPAPSAGFTLEPLEEGLTPSLAEMPLSSYPGSGGGPSFSVRPVMAAVAGGKQDRQFLAVPLFGDPVSQKITCNLQEPHFDEKHPDWLSFEASWNSYWEQLSQGREYPETQKLEVLKNCLSLGLQNEIKLMYRSGQKPGFTTVFAWLKAKFGLGASMGARRLWQEVCLHSSNKVKPSDWREFVTNFNMAKINVKDATLEETYRLLLRNIPSFIVKWVVEEECKRSSKNPQVRLQAIANLTSPELTKAIQDLAHVTPRAVKSIGGSEYLIDFDSSRDSEKLLLLSGRIIKGQQKPLIAELVEYKMTPEDIDRFVYEKLCTWERANEAAGFAKDFFPAQPTKGGRFSTRICSLEGTEGVGGPCQSCSINQLASSADSKKSDSKPSFQKVGPAPQAQGTFLCFGCGGPGHLKRNCPFATGSQWDSHMLSWKGKGGKGAPQQGFAKGFGGKGQGRGSGKGGAASSSNSGRGAGKGSQQPSISASRPEVSHMEVQCSQSQ